MARDISLHVGNLLLLQLIFTQQRFVPEVKMAALEGDCIVSFLLKSLPTLNPAPKSPGIPQDRAGRSICCPTVKFLLLKCS